LPVLALTTPASAGALEGLHWLEGTWKRQTHHGAVTETWRVLSERTLEGESHRVAESGERRLAETILIAEMGGEVFYIPRPLENPSPVFFRLTEQGHGRAVFENPEHDFPTRIVYEKTGDASFTATIEGPADEGEEPQQIHFHFERVR
jgi:hypothetical protein